MNGNDQRTITLGHEYDESTQEALRNVLLELGVSMRDKTWGLGGSQEVALMTVDFGEHELIVRAETYLGLTITGDKDIVTLIAKLVADRKN